MTGNDHPLALCTKRTVAERLILQKPHDPRDVVFHVSLVIDQVWIGPSVAGSNENLRVPARWRESHARSHRWSHGIAKQRTFELVDEAVAEASQDVEPVPPLVEPSPGPDEAQA